MFREVEETLSCYNLRWNLLVCTFTSESGKKIGVEQEEA